MLGTRSTGMSARELSRSALILESARTALRSRRKAAGPGLRTAIEDRLAALNSLAGSIDSSWLSSRRWRGWRSLVHGTRPGLRHDHLAHLRRRRGWCGNLRLLRIRIHWSDMDRDASIAGCRRLSGNGNSLCNRLRDHNRRRNSRRRCSRLLRFSDSHGRLRRFRLLRSNLRGRRSRVRNRGRRRG